MEWWGWVIGGVVLLGFLGSSSQARSKPKKQTGRQSNGPAPDIEAEAALVASRVSTEAMMEALEQRHMTAWENWHRDEKGSAALERKALMLERAVEIALERVVRYQSNTSLDLHSTLDECKNSFLVLSAAKFDELRGDPSFNTKDWFPLKIYDEPEEKPTWFPSLVKYIRVRDSNLSDSKKEQKYKEITESDPDFAEEFPDAFQSAEDIEADRLEGLRRQLRKTGLPKSKVFFDKGFQTKEAVLALQESEVAAWAGMGPKSLEAFRVWKAQQGPQAGI